MLIFPGKSMLFSEDQDAKGFLLTKHGGYPQGFERRGGRAVGIHNTHYSKKNFSTFGPMSVVTNIVAVSIYDVKVSDFYYEFKYRVDMDGGKVAEGDYWDDHSEKPEDVKERLLEGGALRLVMLEVFGGFKL